MNRYNHESLINVTPADVCFGEASAIEDKKRNKKEDFKEKKKTQFINYLIILNY